MKKRNLRGLTAVFLAGAMLLTGCGQSGAGTDTQENTGNSQAAQTDQKKEETAEGAIVMKLGHVVADDSSLDNGLDYLAELVKEKSGGSMVIEVYPNSTLGDNRAMIEQMQFGTLEMMAPSVAALSGFTNKTMLLDLPYLFKNEGAAEEVLDGEIGTEILDELKNNSLIGLGWFTQSWRNVTCNKDVHKPEDMKGLKIRTMDSELHMAHFNQLGASAIPMSMSEVYTALQQHTIDAQENPYTNIVTSKFYEVQDYVIETRHIYDACPLLVSQKCWDSLTEEQKEILKECVREAVEKERKDVLADDDAYKKTVEESGTTINALTDEERQAFRQAVQPVYDKYAPTIGQDLIDRVEEINSKH